MRILKRIKIYIKYTIFNLVFIISVICNSLIAQSSQFSIVSWNVQTFGGSVSQERQNAFATIFSSLMKGDTRILAAQEVSNDAGNNTLLWLLPGGDPIWHYSFENTSNNQDYGIWYNSNLVSLDAEGFVF